MRNQINPSIHPSVQLTKSVTFYSTCSPSINRHLVVNRASQIQFTFFPPATSVQQRSTASGECQQTEPEGSLTPHGQLLDTSIIIFEEIPHQTPQLLSCPLRKTQFLITCLKQNPSDQSVHLPTTSISLIAKLVTLKSPRLSLPKRPTSHQSGDMSILLSSSSAIINRYSLHLRGIFVINLIPSLLFFLLSPIQSSKQRHQSTYLRHTFR